MDQFALTLLETLDRTQWMDRAQFQAHRDALLQAMLRHAFENTRRYRALLAPIRKSDGTFDLCRYGEIPFLSRAEAQADPDAITATSVPAHAGETVFGQTSGSTGISFVHKRSRLAKSLDSAATTRGFSWHGTDFSKTLAIISVQESAAANSPDGEVLPGKWKAAAAGGTLAKMAASLGEEVHDHWLERLQPEYLLAYPTLISSLARRRTCRTWPENLKIVFCTGESLSAETRQNIETNLGARVVDCYGTMEAGLLAFECPVSGLLHVTAETVIVEVLDPSGTPVAAAQSGEVAVTSLVNFAMPVIRYKPGDHATLGPANCDCGRTLPTLRNILGRSRNMFRRPDGSLFWPNVPSKRFLAMIPNRQFRFVQKINLGNRVSVHPASRRPDRKPGGIHETGPRKYPRRNRCFVPNPRANPAQSGRQVRGLPVRNCVNSTSLGSSPISRRGSCRPRMTAA